VYLTTSPCHKVSTCSSSTTRSPRRFPSQLARSLRLCSRPRRRQGLRFALPTVLAPAVVARMATHLSILAIAEWVASQPADVLRALSFTDGITLHQSTIRRPFRKLHADSHFKSLPHFSVQSRSCYLSSRTPPSTA
jgi:hypothetical protein